MSVAAGGLPALEGHWRQEKRQSEGIAADTLIRYAHSLLESVGVERSPSWVSRTVRDYVRHGLGRCLFGEWLTDRLDLSAHQRERSEVAYLLGYADPTGETAARNVDRERGWR